MVLFWRAKQLRPREVPQPARVTQLMSRGAGLQTHRSLAPEPSSSLPRACRLCSVA